MADSLPPAIRQAIASYPAGAQRRFSQLRRLLLRIAKRSDVGELEESLKWGEPAYRPKRARVGTTVRLSWHQRRAQAFGLFVPCSTTLIDEIRTRFPELDCDGSRAVWLPIRGALAMDVVGECFALALTYHRRKRG